MQKLDHDDDADLCSGLRWPCTLLIQFHDANSCVCLLHAARSVATCLISEHSVVRVTFWTSMYVFVYCLCIWCGSGCVVECRICIREVAGSNLSLGYFAPSSAQRSIPPGSVNEYQLQLGRQRQVWLIPIADERVGVQVKLWNPFRTCAIPERFSSGDSLSSVLLFVTSEVDDQEV